MILLTAMLASASQPAPIEITLRRWRAGSAGT